MLLPPVTFIRSLEELRSSAQPLHLALGVFDGVHAGHRAVLLCAVEEARKCGGLAGLLTFDPHPIRVIAPNKAPQSLLTTLGQKARIASSLGVEVFAPIHFDLEMAALPAAEFVRLLLRAPVRSISVGEDWRFGHDRSGDVNLLSAESARLGFVLHAVPPVMFEGDRISSTRIRQALRDGNLAAARAMLLRDHSVVGKVIRGDGLGRQLGFPTANLDPGEAQLPQDGVWAVRADIGDGILRPAVANLGFRPTIGSATHRFETHLIDFQGDLYDREIEVGFLARLRGEQRFESAGALARQVGKDIAAAAEILGNTAPKTGA